MNESQPPCYVICGATGAVGTVLAERLSRSGARLLIAGRNAERLQALGEQLDCETMAIDARTPSSFEAVVNESVDRFGRIDGIANCVGSVLLKAAHATSYEEWNETLETNLTSSFALLRAAGTAMRKTGGSIVFVSSAAARKGLPNHEAIAAAKAGLIGLALSAAATYANRGMRVNTVAPGLVKSNMTRRLWETQAAAQASRSMHALGRLGEPDDVAGLIEWLLSPQSSWVTGQTFGIDGGLATVGTRVRN